MSLAESTAMRFPQPVRVGDLLGREVLRPVESQDVLGRVRGLVRDRDGRIMVVVDFGGFLGFGTRPIAVPVDAMVLLGQDTEIVAFTPEQLRQFPTFSPSGRRKLQTTRSSRWASPSRRIDGFQSRDGLVIELSLRKIPRPVTLFGPHRIRITRTRPAHGFGDTEAMANFFCRKWKDTA